MTRFIQNLLSRHLDGDRNVKPRVRGMYEGEPDRIPVNSESPNGIEAENNTPRLYKPELNQEELSTFWMSEEIKSGTLKKSHKQTGIAPILTEGHTIHKAHENQDEGQIDTKPIFKPQLPQRVPDNDKSISLKNHDTSAIGQISYPRKVHVATPSSELHQGNDGSKSKDHTNAISVSRNSNRNDGATEQNQNNVPMPASAGVISPGRKERMHTIGLPPMPALPKAPSQHVVNISIGRVEIRAVVTPPEVRIPSPQERTERMTLDQFLNQQKSVNR